MTLIPGIHFPTNREEPEKALASTTFDSSTEPLQLTDPSSPPSSAPKPCPARPEGPHEAPLDLLNQESHEVHLRSGRAPNYSKGTSYVN